MAALRLGLGGRRARLLLARDLRPRPAAPAGAHVPTIASFWETILLGARSYGGGAFAPHAELHTKVRLREAHFAQWLHLWCDTVNELFAGDRAELAKAHAHRVVQAFLRRLRHLSSSADPAPAITGMTVTLHGPGGQSPPGEGAPESLPGSGRSYTLRVELLRSPPTSATPVTPHDDELTVRRVVPQYRPQGGRRLEPRPRYCVVARVPSGYRRCRTVPVATAASATQMRRLCSGFARLDGTPRDGGTIRFAGFFAPRASST